MLAKFRYCLFIREKVSQYAKSQQKKLIGPGRLLIKMTLLLFLKKSARKNEIYGNIPSLNYSKRKVDVLAFYNVNKLIK